NRSIRVDTAPEGEDIACKTGAMMSRRPRRTHSAAFKAKVALAAVRGTSMLLGQGIRITIDGKGCWRDDVFVERLWRSIKYEEVYLHAYETVSAAREGIGRYINFYNTRRPHSSLAAKTPDVVYFESLPDLTAKAA